MTILYEVGENLYINLTNRCSNRCTFCTRNHENGYGDADDLWLHGKEPTVEEVKTLLDQRDMAKYQEVVFCGFGEPTERIEEVAELAAVYQNPVWQPHANQYQWAGGLDSWQAYGADF